MAHRKYNYWLGIRGIRFIYHGEWSDPELQYKGKTVNFWDIETWAYYAMKDEDKNPDNPEEFTNWCRENAQSIKETIIEFVTA